MFSLKADFEVPCARWVNLPSQLVPDSLRYWSFLIMNNQCVPVWNCQVCTVTLFLTEMIIIRNVSEELCYSENWSEGCWNLSFEINYIWEYIQTENCYFNLLQYFAILPFWLFFSLNKYSHNRLTSYLVKWNKCIITWADHWSM